MNKKGQEYVGITAMEWAFLVILAVFFSIMILRGIEEQKLNQIKAEDLGLAIESMFILDKDLTLDYELGEGLYFIEELNNRIRVYKTSENKMGMKLLSLGGDFGEQIKGKTNVVRIRKQGKSVVIS